MSRTALPHEYFLSFEYSYWPQHLQLADSFLVALPEKMAVGMKE